MTLIRYIVRALAFDVDGTIADTDPIHADAWARALEKVTGRTFPPERYIAACVDGAMSPHSFISGFSLAGDWPAIEREKRRIYPDMLRSRVTPTPGLDRLLAESDDAGVRTVVVSSSSRESVDAMLETLWNGVAPVAIIARGDSNAAKPDPAPYLAALAQLPYHASEVVAFEDSGNGITSGLAAGLVCVQVGGIRRDGATRINDFNDCSVKSEGDITFLIVEAS